MESKELTVVIVTFKSENKIFSCLDSIPSNISIFVVENSKNENFRTNIESKYSNVKCILTGENKGYSVANNIGLSKVKTKYALILNPDTIVSNNAIKNFFISANNNKDFWLMGPANNYSENDNSNLNKIFEVKNLKGFAIFFNLEKFNKKFFDENFFLYFEEIDLCKNVDTLGGKILINRSIIINHEGGSSVKKNNLIELEKNRNWHWMWSTFYYHKKHKGFFIALLIILPKLVSSVFKTAIYTIIFDKKKKDIYFCRMSGILNSIFGKKSWYRPSLD
jgi:N-acetylglucosaminyl-diphospho-decaprenol L-rhamnosyltransferase